MAGIRDQVYAVRPLIKGGEWLAYGGGVSRRYRQLAEDIRSGPHDYVLDLGCGEAPLLDYVQPARYVGLDSHPPSLERGRQKHERPGWDFVVSDIGASLEPWAGADTVVCSNFFHHLPDGEVVGLIRRIFAEVAPGRICVAEGTTRGPAQPLLNYLDEGSPDRTSEELFELLSEFEIEPTWSFMTRFRTYDLFGFTVRPGVRAAT